MKRAFTVALCDPQKNDSEYEAGMIRDWFVRTSNENARLIVFSGSTELREKLADGFCADIYVIGIPSHPANGIDIARVIHLRQPDNPIIFTAAVKTFAYDAYEIHALRYIMKPAQPDELSSALDLAYLVCRNIPADTVTVRLGSDTRTLNTEDVVFIENNVRNMRYVLRDGTVLTGTRRNVSFEEFFSPLLQSGRFVQPHKSFIVNIRYIRSVKNNGAVLTNGISVPISRRHFSEVQEAYSKYAL